MRAVQGRGRGRCRLLHEPDLGQEPRPAGQSAGGGDLPVDRAAAAGALPRSGRPGVRRDRPGVLGDPPARAPGSAPGPARSRPCCRTGRRWRRCRPRPQERFGEPDETEPDPAAAVLGRLADQPETVEFWQGRYARLHDRLALPGQRVRRAGSSSDWLHERAVTTEITAGPDGPAEPAGRNRARRSRPGPTAARRPAPTTGSRLRRIGPDTRPLSVPAYRRLFLGQVTTVIGAMLTTVAVQQQIFDITGSSAWVGIASLVALVPLVVFGLLGGAIADTYDRRKLLMVTSVGIALTSIGLWIAALIRLGIGVGGAGPAGRPAGLLRGQPADPQRDRPADRAGRHGAGRERAEHDGVQPRRHRRAAAGRRADPAGRAAVAVLHRRADAGGDPVRGGQAAADPAAGGAPGPGQGAGRDQPTCGCSRCC